MAALCLVLVALGGTGARAFPSAPAHTAASLPAPAASAPAPAASLPAPAATDTLVSVGAAPAAGPASVPAGTPVLVEWTAQEQTTCNPGRKKVRLESSAVLPSPAHLQHAPESGCRLLPRTRVPGSEDVRLSGRIPASLTHLDLGIVRT